MNFSKVKELILDKKILSWALYDWANSSYSTTVMAGFFPVFFKSYWSAGHSSVDTTTKLGIGIGVSSFLIAVISPFLGFIADIKNLKKKFLTLFMFMGVISCGGMSFVPQGDWVMAIILYGISMMAFNSSCTFYDALLPYVAQEEEMDFVSSLGYSLGYLGGGVLFLLNVLMYLKPALFAISDEISAVKISFFSVSLWWFVFSLPLIFYVSEDQSYQKIKVNSQNSFLTMLKEFYKTLLEIRKNKNLFLFMVAFWFYIDGVYTVMTMAVDYGISLNFKPQDLIAALLITQFVGFPSAYLTGIVSRKWGCKKPILFGIFVYSVTIVFATQMSTPIHFYILAMVIGCVQGGIQALSRSFFAKMIDKEKSGEYFGLINLIGKFASILGPLIVSLTVFVTGRSQWGLLGLLLLFAAGGMLLYQVKES